ncbi:MAG: hypothetical protein Q8Q09_12290 [Deltaproteobacteria bacterium]|nr:hypothetical protein [Deltaproteobacteria bacterium]
MQTDALTSLGVEVIEILVEGSGASATRSNLDAWITRPGLRLTCAIDSADESGTASVRLGGRDRTFVVSLATMTVLASWQYGGASDIVAAVQDLQTRTGR